VLFSRLCFDNLKCEFGAGKEVAKRQKAFADCMW
jgi:hypothetical protein